MSEVYPSNSRNPFSKDGYNTESIPKKPTGKPVISTIKPITKPRNSIAGVPKTAESKITSRRSLTGLPSSIEKQSAGKFSERQQKIISD